MSFRKRPKWIRVLGLIISVPGGMAFAVVANIVLGLHEVSLSQISDSEVIGLMVGFLIYAFDIGLFVIGMRICGYPFMGYWEWLEMSQIDMEIADQESNKQSIF